MLKNIKLNQIRNASKRTKSTPKRIVAGDLAGNIAGDLAGDLAVNLIGNLAGTLARSVAGSRAAFPASIWIPFRNGFSEKASVLCRQNAQKSCDVVSEVLAKFGSKERAPEL